MSKKKQPWQVALTASAEADIQLVTHQTLQQIGELQARMYAVTLSVTLEALFAGPNINGVIKRDDIATGIYLLHVGRHGDSGNHFILFRSDATKNLVLVLRVLPNFMQSFAL